MSRQIVNFFGCVDDDGYKQVTDVDLVSQLGAHLLYQSMFTFCCADLHAVEKAAVAKLLQLFPLQKRYIVGMIHAVSILLVAGDALHKIPVFLLQLRHACENICDNSAELFGVWGVSECRRFLEIVGMKQIVGEGEDVLLSVSSQFSEEKVEIALKCLDAFKGQTVTWQIIDLTVCCVSSCFIVSVVACCPYSSVDGP